jgi:PAS domain S-box-containing protein
LAAAPKRPPGGVFAMSEPIIDPSVERLLRRFLIRTEDHAVICINPEGRVIGWLGAAEEILGYPAEEAIGQPTGLIFQPEDRRKGLDRYELQVAAEEARSEDDRWHVRKDGTRIWMTGSVMAIKDDAGSLLGFVKVMRDKTDQRAHIQLIENQFEALKASHGRTHRFLSTLGHEIRNPLAPITTACHILSRLSTDPRAEKAVDVISQQVEVLSRLAADLMEVSRAGAGKITLQRKKIDLRVLLNEAVLGMQASADAKGVQLESLMPAGSLEVMLDRERFQRVVLNLLGNAIKYTPRGGTAWVKATLEGPDVLMRIEDTGIGIAPDVLPRIFDLFTQQSEAADLVPGGLGIGLTIVKELVELHGGNVEARSAGVGKGAEFTVRLPAAGDE